MALTEAQEIELLALLELERAEREAQPVDARRSLDDVLTDVLTECAERSADPAAYLSLSQAWDERRRFHLGRLIDALPATEDVGANLAALCRCWGEADRMTAADGYADPADSPGRAVVAFEVDPVLESLNVERLPAAHRRVRASDPQSSPPLPRRVEIEGTAEILDPLAAVRGSGRYDGPIFRDN